VEEIQLARYKLVEEIQLARYKLVEEIQLARYKLVEEIQLPVARYKLVEEIQLARYKLARDGLELNYPVILQWRIQDFKLGGGGGVHLIKLRRAEGGAKSFGVFRVKNHDFMPKKSYFFQF
jgi:hypothetical protein